MLVEFARAGEISATVTVERQRSSIPLSLEHLSLREAHLEREGGLPLMKSLDPSSQIFASVWESVECSSEYHEPDDLGRMWQTSICCGEPLLIGIRKPSSMQNIERVARS